MIVERFAFNSILTKLREQQEDHHAHELDCTALCCACNGQCAVVARLVGDESESERLRDLGLREGAIVTVLRQPDTREALERLGIDVDGSTSRDKFADEIARDLQFWVDVANAADIRAD